MCWNRSLVERAQTAGRLVAAAGVAAALPVLVAIVYVVADGWMAFGDDAYITTLAFDVFTDRSPARRAAIVRHFGRAERDR
jgi:hypothetical protein